MIADLRGEILLIVGLLVLLFVITMIVDVAKNNHLSSSSKITWIIAISLLACTIVLAPVGALMYYLKKRTYASMQPSSSQHK